MKGIRGISTPINNENRPHHYVFMGRLLKSHWHARGRRKREIMPSMRSPKAQVCPRAANPMLLAKPSVAKPAMLEVQQRKITEANCF